MKFRSIILFLLLSKFTFPCQCPHSVLTKAECNTYDIIFRGTVLSVATCDNKPGVAIFKIKDLYKGALTEQFKVIFSCDEECSYQFKEGEEWIIYSNFKQIDRAKLDWCSRSRRLIKNVKEDYYVVTHGNTYDEEAKFLQDSIGIHRLLKQQLNPEELKNKLPSPNQQIIIIICSLTCLILFYYLFNKFFK
ncbi:MAG: hypothetical protein SGJ15_09625 [Bacteroidota bacterium]|nr:hypothetical protein [Bacteroidota bacterium]